MPRRSILRHPGSARHGPPRRVHFEDGSYLTEGYEYIRIAPSPLHHYEGFQHGSPYEHFEPSTDFPRYYEGYHHLDGDEHRPPPFDLGAPRGFGDFYGGHGEPMFDEFFDGPGIYEYVRSRPPAFGEWRAPLGPWGPWWRG